MEDHSVPAPGCPDRVLVELNHPSGVKLSAELSGAAFYRLLARVHAGRLAEAIDDVPAEDRVVQTSAQPAEAARL